MHVPPGRQKEKKKKDKEELTHVERLEEEIVDKCDHQDNLDTKEKYEPW